MRSDQGDGEGGAVLTRLSKVFRLPTKMVSPSMKYEYSVWVIVRMTYLSEQGLSAMRSQKQYRYGGSEKTLGAVMSTSSCYELNPCLVAASQDVLPGLVWAQ